MNEYLRIPRSAVLGHGGVPSLVLGDNGFLRQYGSALTVSEISARLRYVLGQADIGISAGDERVLNAARRARAPWVLHHTDVAFTVDGRKAHFGRSMATLNACLTSKAPDFVATDQLMGRFVAEFSNYAPYCNGACFTTDVNLTERLTTRIRKYRPAMTTIGGDYLDALMAVGAIDEARQSVEPLLEECQRSNSIPVITTYLAGLVEDRDLSIMTEGFAAVMAPLNEVGTAMPPSRELVTTNLRRLGRPIIAMHVLAAGALEPARAIRYVLHLEKAAAAIVGASSRNHISQLINAARLAFEREEV